jgi:hypothetical protein
MILDWLANSLVGAHNAADGILPHSDTLPKQRVAEL